MNMNGNLFRCGADGGGGGAKSHYSDEGVWDLEMFDWAQNLKRRAG